MSRLLTAAHALREDFFDDPCQGDHADYISSSDAAYIATEDRLEGVCDHVQTRGCGDFGVP